MIDVDGQFRRALRYERPFDREIYTIPIRGDVLVEFRQGDWAILYRVFQDLLLGQLSFTRESDLVSIDEEDVIGAISAQDIINKTKLFK